MESVSNVMTELKKKGSAQTRKIYGRHGAPEDMFGVKVADMKTIAKKIKGNQELALELYDSGNADAQYLAGMVANGEQMSKKQLNDWAKNGTWYMVSEFSVPGVASENEDAASLAMKWIKAKKENVASTGWATYAAVLSTRDDENLDLKEVKSLLKQVETSIQKAAPRVRYAMNGFVISVGSYVKPLLKEAKATAKKIGKVEVDMGETSCKVPFAPDYITKIEKLGRVGKKEKNSQVLDKLPGRIMPRNFYTPIAVLLVTLWFVGCGDRSQVGVRKAPAKENPTLSNSADDEKQEVNTEPPSPALLDPSLATETAPEKFQVRVETTKGDFIVEVTRKWSPYGADRFYNLAKIGFYNNIAIHRAINNFVFQFGVHGNPNVTRKWNKSRIKDDPKVGIPNNEGYVSFAKTQRPDSRTTQIFVNTRSNKGLDRQGFTPFGLVVKGFDVLSLINTEYGEVGPEISMMMETQGASYVKRRMPNIDYIKTISLLDESEMETEAEPASEETEAAPVESAVDEPASDSSEDNLPE